MNFDSLDSTTSYLNLLRNQIDITQVPFSDRGSRLLVFQKPRESSLFIKLAEGLIGLDQGIDSYLSRPPYISDLSFVSENGRYLKFETVTQPNVVYFRTKLGEFGMVF